MIRLPIENARQAVKTAGGVIWHILDQRAFMKVYLKLGKDDEQAAELLYEVLTTLEDKLTISNRESQALGRISQLVKAGSGWKPALQRNNIFKAADLLGIRLPSGMFASANKTAKVEYRMRGDALHMFVLQAMGKRQVEAAQVDHLAMVFRGQVDGAMERVQIDSGGPFKSWKITSASLESTRGGLAFHVNVTAKLVDPDLDIYDRAFMKALKGAFKHHGIAF